MQLISTKLKFSLMSKACSKLSGVICSTLWLLVLTIVAHQSSTAHGLHLNHGPLTAPLQKDVNGVVKDADGKPLAGITITIKGTKKSKVSASDGSFTISANEGDVLVFSGIAFETREVAINGDSSYNVVLAASTSILSDVVVVGYGKASRKNVSSAITTIKPEDLNKGAISDIGQLLQGKVAGLNITASGDPNRPAAVILRGASTLNSSQGPFYVIDGIPGADIATI